MYLPKMGRPSPKTPAQRAVENGWDLAEAFNNLYCHSQVLQQRHDAYLRFHQKWFLDKNTVHSTLCGKLPTSKPGVCDCHVSAAQRLYQSFPGEEEV